MYLGLSVTNARLTYVFRSDYSIWFEQHAGATCSLVYGDAVEPGPVYTLDSMYASRDLRFGRRPPPPTCSFADFIYYKTLIYYSIQNTTVLTYRASISKLENCNKKPTVQLCCLFPFCLNYQFILRIQLALATGLKSVQRFSGSYTMV